MRKIDKLMAIAGALIILAVIITGNYQINTLKTQLITAQQTTLETVANFDQAKIDFDLQMTVLREDNDFLTEDNLRQQALIAQNAHIKNQNEAILLLKAELDKLSIPEPDGGE